MTRTRRDSLYMFLDYHVGTGNDTANGAACLLAFWIIFWGILSSGYEEVPGWLALTTVIPILVGFALFLPAVVVWWVLDRSRGYRWSPPPEK